MKNKAAQALAKLSHQGPPSPARKAASAANGAKGGRPRKPPIEWTKTESGEIVASNVAPRVIEVRDYSKSTRGRRVNRFPASTEPWPTGTNKL